MFEIGRVIYKAIRYFKVQKAVNTNNIHIRIALTVDSDASVCGTFIDR
jgi:hypothetical protein